MNKKILVYFIVLLFAVTTPATSVTAAPPTEESEFYYGVEYDWNEMAAAHRIGKHDVGVIAQQVEEVLPDAVEHRETGMMAVRYERLVPLLIEAIKELKSEIDELKGK